MVVKRYNKGGLLGVILRTSNDFWHETSISGISNAAKADGKSNIRRILWLAVTIFLLTVTFYNVGSLFKTYFEYPVTYSMYNKPLDSVKFPSVTICNQNRVHCHNLKRLINDCKNKIGDCDVNAKHAEVLNEINGFCEDYEPNSDNESGEHDSNSGSDSNANNQNSGTDSSNGASDSNTNDQNSGTGTSNGGSDSNSNDQDGGTDTSSGGSDTNEKEKETDTAENDSINRNKRETTDNEESSGEEDEGEPSFLEEENEFLRLFMTLPSDIRGMIGHNVSSFIQSCTFNGRNCRNESFFFLTETASYGNCFSFNSGFNVYDRQGGKRHSSMTGPFFGLSLILNIEQSSYIGQGFTKQAGARAVIHDSSLQPLVDEIGFNLMPNALTEAIIQSVNIQRQKAPFTSNCYDSWTQTNYSEFIDSDLKYSMTQCQRTCTHSSILNDCGCYHAIFVDGDIDDSEPCNMTSTSDEAFCVKYILKQLNDKVRNCSCEVDCIEQQYDVFTSQTRWPSEKFALPAGKKYGYANDKDGIEDNLLQLNVYFKTLSERKVEELPVYSNWYSNSFLSAFGGALSLFLGISLSMLLEVVEWIIDIIINLWLAFTGPKKI